MMGAAKIAWEQKQLSEYLNTVPGKLSSIFIERIVYYY